MSGKSPAQINKKYLPIAIIVAITCIMGGIFGIAAMFLNNLWLVGGLASLFSGLILWQWWMSHRHAQSVQALLQLTEQRFNLTVQGTNSGLWEYNLETDQVVWSQYLCHMLGMTVNQHHSNWDCLFNRIHPEDKEWVNILLKQHWHYKTVFDVEFRIQHESGDYIWVQGFAQTHRHPDGTPAKMAGSFTNIHKRKTTELQFQRTSQHNRNILTALDQSAIVAITDPQGIITHANEKFCAISGYTRAELVGKTHQIINSDYHDKAFIKELWDTILAGQVWHGDICNRAKNGELYWVKTTIVPYLDLQGNPYQFVSLRHDITAQKQAEMQLIDAKDQAEQASQLKSQFLKIISHELRTPLNAITGVNQLLNDTPLNSEQKALCQTLTDSSDALYALVSDILDFEHLNQYQLDLQYEAFNINQMLSQVIQQNRITDHNQNRIMLYIPPDLPHTLYGDNKRLSRVLSQLVRNAAAFTFQGDITLSAKSQWIDDAQSQCAITFSIQDTGCGIPQDKLKHLFDPFTQLETFSTRKTQGLGLGLAICQKIINHMGGCITVTSTVNQGSTFEFTLCLPCEKALHTLAPFNTQKLSHLLNTLEQNIPVINNGDTVSSLAKAPNYPIPKPVKAPTTQILLVEDNPINQMVTTRLLEKLGYTVDTAINGLVALEKIQNNTYQCIFMDVQMPEMDGLETTERIRRYEQELPNNQKTYIIALTANAMSGDREECLNAGMDDYLSKPIEKAQLANKLQKYQVYPSATSSFTSGD